MIINIEICYKHSFIMKLIFNKNKKIIIIIYNVYFTCALNIYKEDHNFYLPLQIRKIKQIQIVDKIFVNSIECNQNVPLNSCQFPSS